jgi:hypothetical protein
MTVQLYDFLSKNDEKLSIVLHVKNTVIFNGQIHEFKKISKKDFDSIDLAEIDSMEFAIQEIETDDDSILVVVAHLYLNGKIGFSL